MMVHRPVDLAKALNFSAGLLVIGFVIVHRDAGEHCEIAPSNEVYTVTISFIASGNSQCTALQVSVLPNIGGGWVTAPQCQQRHPILKSIDASNFVGLRAGLASVLSDRRERDPSMAKPDEVVQTPVAGLSSRDASRAANADSLILPSTRQRQDSQP